MSRWMKPVSSVFDPRSLISGSPSRADDFTGLAVGTMVHGRALPVGWGSWNADASWIGDGAGACGSTTGNKAMKGTLAHSDCDIRAIFDPGITSCFVIFCRDVESTPACRYGFLWYYSTSESAVGMHRSDNSMKTSIGPSTYYPVTTHQGWNVLRLHCVGQSISGYFNGVHVITATDGAYSTARSMWGVQQYFESSADAKLDYVEFTVL